MFDIDHAHEADLRAERAAQLAADIDIDIDMCHSCNRTLRHCACCHACGDLIGHDGFCGCADESDDEAMMALYHAEIEAEERALWDKSERMHDDMLYSDDPHADRARWQAERIAKTILEKSGLLA